MHRLLLAPAAALLAACCLTPEAAAPAAFAEPVAEVAAERPDPPVIEWGSTGNGGYVYHQVWGDCQFLSHGNGRNSAWGRWRLPLTEVSAGEIVSDGYKGFEIHYTCKDGSDCIQSGTLEDTPNRVGSHIIPFETVARAEIWLADVASLEKACRALK